MLKYHCSEQVSNAMRVLLAVLLYIYSFTFTGRLWSAEQLADLVDGDNYSSDDEDLDVD